MVKKGHNMMNPRRLQIQRKDKIKVNIKIKAKVSKKLRSLIFQRKKVIIGIVVIMIKMIIVMINVEKIIRNYVHISIRIRRKLMLWVLNVMILRIVQMLMRN